MSKNGKKEKNKKPFYKRIWFWIVIIIVISAFTPKNNDNKSQSTNSNDTKVTKVTKSPKKENNTKQSLPIDLTSQNYKDEITKDAGSNVKFESIRISDDDVGTKVAVISFTLKSAITEKMAVRGILMEMTDILKTTKQKFDYSKISNIEIFAKLPMTDTGGNTNNEIVATSKISGQRLTDLNIKNFDSTKIPVFVNEYWQSDSLPTVD